MYYRRGLCHNRRLHSGGQRPGRNRGAAAARHSLSLGEGAVNKADQNNHNSENSGMYYCVTESLTHLHSDHNTWQKTPCGGGAPSFSAIMSVPSRPKRRPGRSPSTAQHLQTAHGKHRRIFPALAPEAECANHQAAAGTGVCRQNRVGLRTQSSGRLPLSPRNG